MYDSEHKCETHDILVYDSYETSLPWQEKALKALAVEPPLVAAGPWPKWTECRHRFSLHTTRLYFGK